MAKVKESKEVEKLKKKNKRIKRALRVYRFRPLKNLFILFVGMILGVVFFFGGIGAVLMYVPLNTFVGDNRELLSEEIANQSIVDVFMNLSKYGIDDMPIARDVVLDLVDTADLDKFISFDKEKFTALQFSYDDDRTFLTELQGCITVIASLNSLGVTEMLGDLANVSIFKEYKLIESENDMPTLDENGNISKDGEEFVSNPKLYYYQVEEEGAVVYKRAFDDQGQRLCGAEDQLYFPNVAEIPLLETTHVLSDSMSIIEINELLSVFGAGDAFNDSFLGGILEGKKIGDMSNIKQSDFLVKDILGEKTESNQKMYDILITGAEPYDIDGDGIADAVTYDNLNLEHVKNCNVDNVYLSSVMPKTSDNQKLYDILLDVSKEGDPEVTEETLSIKHLTSFNIDNLHLNNVITKTGDNQKLFDILTDVTGKNEDELTLKDLENFNVDKLHLSKVMPTPNEKLKSILVDAFKTTYSENTYENIKLEDLSGDAFSFDNIKLKTVIGSTSSNPIIATLINNNSSIGTISSDIDNLSLFDVYGHECFIKYDKNVHSKLLRYDQVTDGQGKITGYQQADQGYYVIDPTAGVWLLLCFDSSDMITTGEDHVGRYNTYTVADETMSHLNDHTGEHSVSKKITNASIRQLVDVGILESANPALYKYSLQEALKPLA